MKYLENTSATITIQQCEKAETSDFEKMKQNIDEQNSSLNQKNVWAMQADKTEQWKDL